MTPIPAKVTAIEKRGDQHHVATTDVENCDGGNRSPQGLVTSPLFSTDALAVLGPILSVVQVNVDNTATANVVPAGQFLIPTKSAN